MRGSKQGSRSVCGRGGCYCPLTWFLVHEAGIHATVAGVLMGFAVPVIRRSEGPGPGLAEHFEHRFRPLSSGVAVPVFAFFAAGVSVAGAGGLGASLTDSIGLGIIAGLVVGKVVGVLGATWLVQRFTPRSAGRGSVVVGRAGFGPVGRDRVHRVAADRGAGVRRAQRVRRPRQDRGTARFADLGAARRDRAADPQRSLPAHLRRRGGRSRRDGVPDVYVSDASTGPNASA